jgi:hypothetical protein
MKIEYVEKQPQETRFFEHDPAGHEGNEHDLSPSDVRHVAEIFKSTLVSTYNWDYSIPDSRLKRLYELGKELNWNVEKDLDWSERYPITEFPVDEKYNPYVGFKPYDDLPREEKVRFAWHRQALGASGALHGEQGALMVAAQLACNAPSYEAKLYAASQTFDEARHMEFFNKYIQHQIGVMYPVGPGLKALIDTILKDERWDLKFIGMQIIIEGLALAAFNTTKMQSNVPVHKTGLHYVIRDEARHVTFGVNFLEDYCKALPQSELEERAEFACHAIGMMSTGGRGNGTKFYQRYGWNAEEVRAHFARNGTLVESGQGFRQQLFGRVVPNLKRIGLLTDKVRPFYERVGALAFEDLPSDAATSWENLSKPLVYEEQADSVIATSA